MLMDCQYALKMHQGTNSESIYNDLAEFDLFHLLMVGDIATSTDLCMKYGYFSKEFIDWFKYCAGGQLFDTDMFALVAGCKDPEFPLETFSEHNKPADGGFPSDRYFAFAQAVYGDLYCFERIGERKFGEKVYQWDIEKQDFSLEWDSFYKWMRDIVDDAIIAIDDGDIEPIPLKMEE